MIVVEMDDSNDVMLNLFQHLRSRNKFGMTGCGFGMTGCGFGMTGCGFGMTGCGFGMTDRETRMIRKIDMVHEVIE